MVRLWKIIFDLVLTMPVGLLLKLGGAVRKQRLKKKVDFLKIQKLIPADNFFFLSHNFFYLV